MRFLLTGSFLTTLLLGTSTPDLLLRGRFGIFGLVSVDGGPKEGSGVVARDRKSESERRSKKTGEISSIRRAQEALQGTDATQVKLQGLQDTVASP